MSSPHFHVFSYASCVDLTQLLLQPNASWRTQRSKNLGGPTIFFFVGGGGGVQSAGEPTRGLPEHDVFRPVTFTQEELPRLWLHKHMVPQFRIPFQKRREPRHASTFPRGRRGGIAHVSQGSDISFTPSTRKNREAFSIITARAKPHKKHNGIGITATENLNCTKMQLEIGRHSAALRAAKIHF